MKEEPIREFRKCKGCRNYFWSVHQSGESTDWIERLKYCSECWNNRLQKPTSLAQIERENSEMSEEEKQAENTREEQGSMFQNDFRRYKTN